VLQDGSTGHIALITVLACVVFLTVLAAMTSVTFAAAVSLTHDVFARGKRLRTETQELRALRMAAVSVCAVGLSLAAAIHRYPTEFLVAFSISVAATCVFPALIYSSSGVASTVEAYCGPVYGGLLLCTVLTAFSPIVSGTAFALWPQASFDWYPFQTPGLISVPAAFALGRLGSITSSREPQVDFRHVQHEILTGQRAR
jgi:cation/acetate symporter